MKLQSICTCLSGKLNRLTWRVALVKSVIVFQIISPYLGSFHFVNEDLFAWDLQLYVLHRALHPMQMLLMRHFGSGKCQWCSELWIRFTLTWSLSCLPYHFVLWCTRCGSISWTNTGNSSNFLLHTFLILYHQSILENLNPWRVSLMKCCPKMPVSIVVRATLSIWLFCFLILVLLLVSYWFCDSTRMVQVVAMATAPSYRPLLDACAGYLSAYSPVHVRVSLISQ